MGGYGIGDLIWERVAFGWLCATLLSPVLADLLARRWARRHERRVDMPDRAAWWGVGLGVGAVVWALLAVTARAGIFAVWQV